jgi:hypothetical protein
MISDLAGEDGAFTYDSPKFVEAVIRLARGANPAHGVYPVLRFDEDVDVNEAAIDSLLGRVSFATQSNLYDCSFFSGGYGSEKGLVPVNDFAVRLVGRWQRYVNAIQGLNSINAYWLFRQVEAAERQ